MVTKPFSLLFKWLIRADSLWRLSATYCVVCEMFSGLHLKTFWSPIFPTGSSVRNLHLGIVCPVQSKFFQRKEIIHVSTKQYFGPLNLNALFTWQLFQQSINLITFSVHRYYEISQLDDSLQMSYIVRPTVPKTFGLQLYKIDTSRSCMGGKNKSVIKVVADYFLSIEWLINWLIIVVLPHTSSSFYITVFRFNPFQSFFLQSTMHVSLP